MIRTTTALLLLLTGLALGETAVQKPAKDRDAKTVTVEPAAATEQKIEISVAKKPAERVKPDPLEKIKAETAELVAQREKIAAQMALEQTKLDEKLAARKRELAQIQIQIEEIKAKSDLADAEQRARDYEELSELRREYERVNMKATIAKNTTDIEGFEMRQEENAIRRKTTALTLAMELQQKETESRTYAGKAPTYLKDPVQGNKLILSDRTIALNGAITTRTADNIAERIAYYNNRDAEAPIFIVIDDSPGGSVMAGYKILKSMHGSKAPVYTVVKSFAGSMAACITTLSKRSFAYPNAVILHHQLSAGVMGNLTQHRESVKELEEWWKRLADPVAEKMGLTRDEFITAMYKKSSTGDWNEFADNAQKLKWVDTIIEEIEETALLRHPDSNQAAQTAGNPLRISPPGHHMESGVIESNDERGKPVGLLPRLNPLDAYWMYNPDGYYRMQ